MKKVIFLFPSIHYVLKAEKHLKKEGFEPEIIPVPKELSSDCGMALAFEEEKAQRALLTLPEGLKPEKVFRRTGQGYEELPW
ncbi:MAG TPA: DUF3343 domain-containing protein [Thermodesulfatator atlanticus]|uniref:DUF3343 domain-containing protein n=1 Tax=Thermodesulfatator atlanticus TaxID=501497 RepID=A0A7V5P0I3_9BACT|nr:DUF3343 domain-containing protein [Thermodesulfatator atlanticus]